MPPALAPALRTISGETPHYRARFEVAAADGADAAGTVKAIVMGWLHAKGLEVPEGAADIAVPAGWTAADEPDAAKAVRFLGLSGAQGAAWAVETDELDGEFSRRRWHTRIGLAPAGDGGCILNVQVSHYAVNGFFGYQRNPLPSVPRVVRDILACGGLDVRIGPSRVSAEEIYLDADTLRGDFMPSLTDRARCLPIVLMTTDDDGKTPVWDATELASKLVGMATVYVIDMRDGALVQSFRDLLPDRTPAGRYRIGRSAVMVYRPGIDLSTEESLSACTLFTRHRVERYSAGGRDGFINVLMQGLGRGIDARPGDVAGVGDVLWLRSRAESERQGERIDRPAFAREGGGRAGRRYRRPARGDRAPALRCRGLGGDRDGSGSMLLRCHREGGRANEDRPAARGREARTRAQGGAVRGPVGRRRGREGGRMPPGDPARPDGPVEARSLHLA